MVSVHNLRLPGIFSLLTLFVVSLVGASIAQDTNPKATAPLARYSSSEGDVGRAPRAARSRQPFGLLCSVCLTSLPWPSSLPPCPVVRFAGFLAAGFRRYTRASR